MQFTTWTLASEAKQEDAMMPLLFSGTWLFKQCRLDCLTEMCTWRHQHQKEWAHLGMHVAFVQQHTTNLRDSHKKQTH